jgi:hypothetical protein
VSNDKGPSPGPQLLPFSRKDLTFWRQQAERLRASLPQLTPEQREQLSRLREMLRTLPAALVPPDLAEQLRVERDRQLYEPGPVPEPQPPSPVEQVEQVFEWVDWIEQTSKERSEWIAQMLEQNERPAEQSAEPTPEMDGLPLEEIEQRMQGPQHPPGRPEVEFPHLQQALADLEDEPSLKSMQPKQERDFVMKRLRDYGDKVNDSQEKTIDRRISNWRRGKSAG